MTEDRQEFLDRFYFQHGPCCAGCDWWRSINSLIGDCHRTAPKFSDAERWGMLGISNVSYTRKSVGHAITRRDYHCGEFKDEFDWSSLPLPYRKRIGELDRAESARSRQ
jgi:hypothetical protein